MVHYVLMAELKFEIFKIDIGVWKDDKLNLDLVCLFEINCKCTGNSFGIGFVRLARSRSCVDFTEIVCRFRSKCSSRDRVSLSPKSYVDFARCSLEFGSDLKNLYRGGEL